MNPTMARKFNTWIFSMLIFGHSIQTHAQFEHPPHAQIDSFSSVFNWVIQGHVIKTFSNVAGVGRCIMECSFNEICYSLNYYPSVGVCELNSATHASHVRDYVPSNNGSFLLYLARPARICDNSFCSSGQKCFLEKEGVSRLCKDCSSPLGIEDGSVPDSALSSSSSYGHRNGDPSYRAKFGRLNRNFHPCCWAPAYTRAGEFLQADLGEVKIVTKVATQGRYGEQVKYVTKYIIKWSRDGQVWTEYKENGVVKVFNGNVDQNSVVTNNFQKEILTRHVRLVVQEWHYYAVVRMELYGCPLH